MAKTIGCAVIGYGPQHNFGWVHAAWIEHTPELELVAVCDIDPARTAAAQQAFPRIRTYNDTKDLFADPDIELVSIVTPHHTHCALTLAAFAAGKHVVVEKAMCLNVAEATAMIEAGREAGRMLAVHHNRRHDGNFRTVMELIHSGRLGEVFHIELSATDLGHPGRSWYTDKEKSGGGLYFWGPHAVDWLLQVVPARIAGVTAFSHKLLWDDISNEEHIGVLIRFANGTVAQLTWSYIACAGKPLWIIQGTKGALVDSGIGGNVGYEKQIAGPSGGSLKVIERTDDGLHEEQIPYQQSDWPTYWQDIADHLLRGEPIPVSGETGRRVIAVLETANRAAETGQTEQVPGE